MKSQEQQRPWHKHTLFLILLNTIAFASFLWSIIQLDSVWIMDMSNWFSSDEAVKLTFEFAIDSNIITLVASLIGLLIGHTIGYTIWAKDDNFPQSRAILLGGLWAGAFGATFFSANFVLLGILLFPALALLITLEMIGRWRGAFIKSVLLTIPLATLLSLFISQPRPIPLPIWCSGGIFGWLFSSYIKHKLHKERIIERIRDEKIAITRDHLSQFNDNILMDDEALITYYDQHLAETTDRDENDNGSVKTSGKSINH